MSEQNRRKNKHKTSQDAMEETQSHIRVNTTKHYKKQIKTVFGIHQNWHKSHLIMKQHILIYSWNIRRDMFR